MTDLLGHCRIMEEAELVCMAGVQFSCIIRLLFTESNAHYQCFKDRLRDIVQSPVQLGCELPKARQDLFWEPDVVVLMIVIAPDLVAFLVTQVYING